jgi:hypothetical protein
MAAATGHRSLPVVQQPATRAWPMRLTVLALSLAAAALFIFSYFQPWWRLWLFAPQYPKGLEVGISLTGVSGDVREINILNHYIGMKPLELAAIVERRLAAQGIGIIAVLVVLLSLIPGKKLGWLAAAAGAAFPITFILDSQYWLYHFGNTLNPKAPIRLPPFTPQMFGTGKIGQFYTWARPDTGFWIAMAGVGLLVAAAIIRWKVCARCARNETCHAVCPDGFVGPHAGLPKE